jgi:crossover junction endodeoxyribonuclease RuvC
MITALGVDPGLRATGYSVLQGDRQGCRLLEFGVLRTTGPEMAARLGEIFSQIEAVIREYPPQVMVLEDVFAHVIFPRTALHLAHLRGVITLAAVRAGVTVETLTPAAVKRALAGSGRAGKVQVQKSIARLLGLGVIPPQHSADATALALTALSRRGVALRPTGVHALARA